MKNKKKENSNRHHTLEINTYYFQGALGLFTLIINIKYSYGIN